MNRKMCSQDAVLIVHYHFGVQHSLSLLLRDSSMELVFPDFQVQLSGVDDNEGYVAKVEK